LSYVIAELTNGTGTIKWRVRCGEEGTKASLADENERRVHVRAGKQV